MRYLLLILPSRAIKMINTPGNNKWNGESNLEIMWPRTKKEETHLTAMVLEKSYEFHFARAVSL